MVTKTTRKTRAKSYDSSNIKNLQFPENVRHKPTLYIGPIDARGILTITREITDNVVDEALQGRATACHVYIDQTSGSYSIADDGAGIPVGNIKVTDPVSQKTHKVSALKAAVGLLNTSGKFDDKAYATSRGCFTGDMRVLLSGENDIIECSFSELHARWQWNQAPISVEAYNLRTLNLTSSSLITHVQITKHTTNLIKVFTEELLGHQAESFETENHKDPLWVANDPIICTPDHPFFVISNLDKAKRLRVVASELQPGQFLQGYSGLIRVAETEPYQLDTPVPVYDITVEGPHNYWVVAKQGSSHALVSNSHGIGSKATNALSTKFSVHTFRDGYWWHTSYSKGKVIKDVAKAKAPVDPVTGKRMKKGTLITFTPDTGIFTESAFPLSMLNEWATIAAFFTPNFKVVVATSEGKSKTYHFPNGPKDYITGRIAKHKTEPLSPKMFNTSNALVDCVVQFTNLDGTDFSAFTNGLRNVEGGVHLNAFYSALKDSLSPFAKKDQSFTVHDLREGIVGIINVKLSHPQFDSQTKEKLVDDRANQPVFDYLKKEMIAFFTKNKSLAHAICEQANAVRSLKDKFKLSRDAIKKIKKISKQGFPVKATVVPKIAPAQRSLFLVEGDSAGGSAKIARTVNDELLPLRGKILNSAKTNDSKVFASEEVLNILAMIGYDPDHKDPMSALRVGRVILLADPDPDGPLHGKTLIPVFENGVELHRSMEELYNRSEKINVRVWNGMSFEWHEVEPPRIETVKDRWLQLTFDLVSEDASLASIEIECTANHHWCMWSPDPDSRSRIRLNNGMYCVRAEQLVVGDELARYDSDERRLTKAIVSKVQWIKSLEEEPFYCFQVPGFHNFTTVGGIVSKNCHINSLLLTLFARYLPEMFERNMIYLALTKPFYAFDDAKEILYTGDTALEVQEQLSEAKAPARLRPSHLKGWGECPPPLLKRLAFDPSTRLLAQIQPASSKDEHKEFELIMGESAAARRRLLGIDTGAIEPPTKSPAKKTKATVRKKIAKTRTVA